MTTKISKQMINGKAFELALLKQFKEKLEIKTKVKIIKNSSLDVAKKCFSATTKLEQSDFLLSASFAVNFLIDIEPRLSNSLNLNDLLELEILSDNHGKKGDVRDVIAIRLAQKWCIGVSAKNNHKAVKHSRLSSDIDFGKKWIGTPVSKEYFKEITPIFSELKSIRKKSNATKKWSELPNHHTNIYLPILKAFSKELEKLNKKDPQKTANNIIQYLVGKEDFYKIIKKKDQIEIHAYNINETLNLPFKNVEPKYNTPKVELPTKIEKIYFKENVKTTVIVEFNNDWALSFRIHSASSRVEGSLKFDINLLKSPKSLYKNKLSILAYKKQK